MTSCANKHTNCEGLPQGKSVPDIKSVPDVMMKTDRTSVMVDHENHKLCKFSMKIHIAFLGYNIYNDLESPITKQTYLSKNIL